MLNKIKLSKLRKIYATMYQDKMTVFRHIKKLNDDGSISNKLELVPILKEIPCKLSLKSRDYAEVEKESDTNDVRLEIKVFCDPTHDIRKGDKLIITIFDDITKEVLRTYSGYANLSFVYNSHQEIEIIKLGSA